VAGEAGREAAACRPALQLRSAPHMHMSSLAEVDGAQPSRTLPAPPHQAQPTCTLLAGLFDRRFTAADHSKQEKLFAIASHDVSKAFGTAIAGEGAATQGAAGQLRERQGWG